MKSDKSLLILERTKNLARKCETLQGNELFFGLQQNLRTAIDLEEAHIKAPPVISIIGGTGSGKSFIFSRLCNRPDASPSSSSIRGFTKKLFIAAGTSELQTLPFSDDEAVFVPDSIADVVLIDTPDFDSIVDDNARLAGETIRVSDILVVVTTPDKRSNFAIHQKIIEWASRKRWFFVINKTDTATDTSDMALKEELSRKLSTMGFAVDTSAIFAFSARQTDSDEFNRFKNTVFAHRTLAENAMLREEAAARRILFALNNGRTSEKILKLQHELIEFRSTLAKRIVEQHTLVLSSAAIRSMLANSMQAAIYREMTTGLSFFLYPYFALTNVFSQGISPETAQKAIETANASNQHLTDCYIDERRFLEDRSLPGSPTVLVPQTGRSNDVMFQILATARKNYDSALLKFYLILGNALPTLLLGSAVYRATVSWVNGVWLPTDFFVHAFALILIATFPGYLLAAKGISRIAARFSPCYTGTGATELAGLEYNIASIDRILQESSILCSSIDEQLGELQQQLPQNICGITTDE